MDLLTIILPQKLVDAAKENFIKYVNEVGLRDEASVLTLAPISILSTGHVDVADAMNCSRAEGMAEISFFAISQHATVVAKTEKKAKIELPLVAFARCATPLQVKWILSLYE